MFVEYTREQEETDAKGSYYSEGMGAEEKRGKKIFLVLSPRPWPDCPNASGWYRRFREPISPLSLLNCDQL